jgi:AraC-like DNA-binding protein
MTPSTEPPDAALPPGGLRPAPVVLWTAGLGQTQTVPTGSRYHFENRHRLPTGTWFVQATLSGSIELTDAGRTHVSEPGSFLLFRFGERSSYGRREPLTEPYRNRWVSLDGAGLHEHLAWLRREAGPVLPMATDHPLHEAFDELVRHCQPGSRAGSIQQAGRVHRFVLGLIEQVVASRQRARSPVEQAIDHLIEHPLDPLDTPQVAARYGVTREHLTRTFRRRTGQTPARFLEARRIAHAVALLGATDLPIAEIARQSGMRSARHLSDRVRARLGRAPTSLRRN